MSKCAILALLVACDSPLIDQPDAAFPDAPPAVGCDAPLGTKHALTLANGDGLEDRAYWLHVPASYRCESPAPLLVDFHGTASDVPEEAYQTEALIAFADANGVIVARPRSRSAAFMGVNIYRWDQNTGDLPRNVTFAHNLVANLEQRYAIDPARVYASGFSSGANMTAQFLTDPESPFHGIAPIAGGRWTNQVLPQLAAGPRLWISTGYRDYLWPTARTLIAGVRMAGLPDDHLVVRPTVGGHDLYPWHFAELWQFLDGGTPPPDGVLAAPWTAQALPSPADVTALARDGAALVAAGGHGRVWRRAATGTWSLDVDHGAAVDYTALCIGATRSLVGGGNAIADRTGTTWTGTRGFPDFGQLGAGWANTAVCRDDGSIVVGGYWSAAITADGGQTWSRFQAPTDFGVDYQIAGGAQSPGGATVLVGYHDYIGRAPQGSVIATAISHSPTTDWWNAATAISGGRFWAVGDNGAIVASTDDGLTWTEQTSGTTENLYGVHFADALHGAAVGRRGTILVTSDGGALWTARPLGLDRFVGAVVVDSTTITIAGQGGLVATSAR